MTKLDKDWISAILARFEGRENLEKDELYARYFKHLELPRNEVFDCLTLIESEYDFPVGVVRPEDKLEMLFKPVSASTPWRWLVYRGREEDRETELNYQLGNRMRRHGTQGSWDHVKEFGDLTFGDLLKAWCGRVPDNKILTKAKS